MIKMTGYRVLIKPDPLETKTESGIITVTKDKEKLEKTGIQRGVVIDIGPSAWKAFREVDEKSKEHNGKKWPGVGDYIGFALHAGRYILYNYE